MTSEQTEKRTRRSGRSRRYPAISLDKAIERARELYEVEGRHSTPVAEVVRAWGYSNHTSGAATSTYAAVRQFGLVEESGRGDERVARLTDLAFEIIRSPDPTEAIRQAAMTPPVHQEMWMDYGLELPSERSLHWTLVRDSGFTEPGATDFLRQYQDTLAFLRAMDALPGAPARDVAPEVEPVQASQPGPAPTSPEYPFNKARPSESQIGTSIAGLGGTGSLGTAATASRPGATRIPIPLVGGQQIVIEGEFPITEAAWINFRAVLEAFKPGLVTAEPSSSSIEPPTAEEFMAAGTHDAGEDE
jgi:hypothetical protein